MTKSKCFPIIPCFLFLLWHIAAFAQNPNCFRITFSDKDNSPYSIDRPEEFLSPRAIAKRQRFQIPVTEEDFPVNPQYIDAIRSCINSPTYLITTSKWNNSAVILFSGLEEIENQHQFINSLYEQFPFVTDVLPVAYYYAGKNIVPSIPEETAKSIVYSSQTEYDYGNSIEQIRIHNGQFLHRAGFCGENMLICVFDVGWTNFNTLPCFQSLYQNGQILGATDLIPGMTNAYTGHSHGTAVTSIMASTVEGELVGTAPKASYYFIRSDDPIREQLVEEDYWAKAAEIADSLGADVINSSLGYTEFDYPWQNIYTPANNDGMASIASRAASILAKKGVVVVVSAGNSGNSPWQYISHPADAFDILAVGAVNKDSVTADFSSYGPSSDGRVKPDIASVGWDTWVIYNEYAVQGSGTSFAGPVIAGLSACLWQALPQYSSLELMQLIREYGNRYHDPNDRTGYGIPDYYRLYLDHATNINISEQEKYSFSVYPNPTTGQLRIENGELRMENVEIYDIMGRKQKIIINYQISIVNSIDISHLSAGIYLVKIITEQGVITKKIIKQ